MPGTRTKIIKIGNSRGVRIPRQILRQARLQDDVEMTVQGDRVILRAATPPEKDEIVFNARKVPIISGTNMKVIELVTEHLAYGWSPEEIHYQHPYLTMGQIYSALAHYWNHQDEMDREIAHQDQEVRRLRASTLDSPARRRLRKKRAS